MKRVITCPTPSREIKSSHGFTLIEMAVVMVVVGIMITLGVSVLPSLIQNAKIRKTRDVLERVDFALEGYISSNGRCPCPDTDGDGLENRNANDAAVAGDDTCDKYVGDLPYVTIGLPAGVDDWQNTFKYGVHEDVINSDTSDSCSKLASAGAGAFDASKLHITDAGNNSTNQAYVIVSGGPKDLDNAGGFFDGKNGAPPAVEFESPARIIDTTYDDHLRATAFSYLRGKLCTGGSGSGDNSGSDDDDGDDDDDDDSDEDEGDGDPATVDITTASPLASGLPGASYTTQIQATGGLSPYTWSATPSGSLGLSINASNGQLFGTLDQCPGTYTVTVDVSDGTLPAPTTDSKEFSITITSDLYIEHTSGSGGAVTWSQASQKETFQAYGNHLGSIDWTLDAGGATGFAVAGVSGTDTCELSKSGNTTPGSYTFVITATDASCSNNTAQLTLNITVPASGAGTPGEIVGEVDALEFDTSAGMEPELIHISDEVYAIAYRGPGNDGWLKTVRIGADGQIDDSPIDSLEFDTTYGLFPQIVHVTSDIYAIAYTGPGNDGWLKTVQIAADGQIGNTVVDQLEFETNYCYVPDIAQIATDYYVVAYRGPGNDGWMRTVQIAADGQIGNTVTDSHEFEGSYGLDPDIFNVSGDVFAFVYTGPGTDGWWKTFSISSTGVIGSEIASREFDNAYGLRAHAVPVSGEIYALAYRGNGADGWLKTVQIAADGTSSADFEDEYEFDADYGIEPDIVQVGGDYYAIAYAGPGSDGHLLTLAIQSDGSLGASPVISTLEFDTSYGTWADIIHVTGDIFAIAYRGSGNDGWLKTIQITQ